MCLPFIDACLRSMESNPHVYSKKYGPKKIYLVYFLREIRRIFLGKFAGFPSYQKDSVSIHLAFNVHKNIVKMVSQ